jgi:anthranilate synthase component 1
MFEFQAKILQINADDKTPVALYANLRQMFAETLLLECVEARSLETAASYLCADPIAKISVRENQFLIEKRGRKIAARELTNAGDLLDAFAEFQASIKINNSNDAPQDFNLFGYVNFSAIPFLEDIKFRRKPPEDEQIPDLQFALYRYVLRFDYYRQTLTAVELREKNEDEGLSRLLTKISALRAPEFAFRILGAEKAEISDADFADAVRLCQRHIRRGDVFQIVPSRKFRQKFGGDEFQVYRALRRINPSPFLFFFDYGSFSLFGSSPEAQIIVKNNFATLTPIAGTYPRGANREEDWRFAENLLSDAKETAEHTMLVDLARNDLGRRCKKVRVEQFKQTEFYSHVIHLVSKVVGELDKAANAFQIFADTFPAGTLSGAPKYRAMQILNDLEPSARSFYGGAAGFFRLDGKSCTLAIMIRSFLARNRQLIFQAGAGIVADSVPETETAEVRNKLGALRRAIETAEKI